MTDYIEHNLKMTFSLIPAGTFTILGKFVVKIKQHPLSFPIPTGSIAEKF